MTTLEKYRPILIFCSASIGLAIVIALVASALNRDDELPPESGSVEESAAAPTRETRAAAAREIRQTATSKRASVKHRNYLDEYSVDLVNQTGEKIGTVRVQPTSQGVEFNIFARKLWPGPHAIHLHEHGLCEGPDFTSAGGHFNPTNAAHGVPDFDTDPGEQDHHIGDMVGDRVNAQGQLNHRTTNISVTFGPTIGGRYSIADEDGTSLVISSGADVTDTAQTDGVAGPRVACAVITPSDPRTGT